CLCRRSWHATVAPEVDATEAIWRDMPGKKTLSCRYARPQLSGRCGVKQYHNDRTGTPEMAVCALAKAWQLSRELQQPRQPPPMSISGATSSLPMPNALLTGKLRAQRVIFPVQQLAVRCNR